MKEKDIHRSYEYANMCDLDLHCSPFGLGGLFVKIVGTNLMGIGSTMGTVHANTKGLIHYNDGKDFVNSKYKLYAIIEDDGMLRIDFTKVYCSNDSIGSNSSETKVRVDDNVYDADPYMVSSGDPDPYKVSNGDDKKPKQRTKSADDQKEDSAEASEEENLLPSLIFRGRFLDYPPGHIEPFIGIVSFETEDS